MSKLKDYLDAASAAYYAGSPFISDEIFDKLAESADYQAVGAKQHEHIQKHFARMFSLQKYYEGENKKPLEGIKEIVSSLKLDGAAISLLYVDGVLTKATTRGDGIEGQDITAKMYSRKDLVPLNIPGLGVLQVTGEIVSPKNIENARNYAAGALNLKDLEEFKTRAISFFAYGVYPYITDLYSNDMRSLTSLGFDTVFANAELDKIYDCDGIVHRVDSNKVFEELGFTSKHPRGAYALKQRGEAVETILLGVEWAVGKTGKITPTGVLEPVKIGDKVISRATLNNPDFIEIMELYIGCTVAVILGGEIIPKVLYKVH
jgi:NAD-dependent DNA ligase